MPSDAPGLHYDIELGNQSRIWVEVALDLWFPVEVLAVGAAPGLASPEPPHPSVKGGAYTLMAWLDLSTSELAYSLNRVELTAGWKGTEIDGATLRKLSLNGVKDGIGEVLARRTDELPSGAKARSALRSRDERSRGVDERLLEVAHIYARESLSGRRPAKAVSTTMGVPASTASYWIRRAKDMRYVAQDGSLSHAQRIDIGPDTVDEPERDPTAASDTEGPTDLADLGIQERAGDYFTRQHYSTEEWADYLEVRRRLSDPSMSVEQKRVMLDKIGADGLAEAVKSQQTRGQESSGVTSSESEREEPQHSSKREAVEAARSDKVKQSRRSGSNEPSEA